MTLERFDIPAAPPRPLRALDPSAPAEADDALFGFALPLEETRLVALPVPYEATVSSRGGTLDGPRAVVAGSAQVDLLDPLVGEPWRAGIGALPESAALRALSAEAHAAVDRAREGDEAAARLVDDCGRQVWDFVEDHCGRLLDSGRAPLVLGGEHALSVGAFRAAARRRPGLGILQIDAHADLRAAYEGFVTSHASVMRRALETEGVSRIVQVGLRDFCVEEREASRDADGRSIWFTDAALASRLLAGETFAALAREIVAALPDDVWVSFDIDGLDASLCPGTGTPVPGGLTWREATYLLAELGRSGKRVVGADLVETGPDFWDGYVAAKALYLLAGIVEAPRR
ncbi:MAG TPA: arginase family protein [Acidobacteriota bacterium]|nr:arginase family protein [Acidobacteriota bacterium]